MSKWAIHTGDALESLKGMPDASFDAVLCDPPYGLKFMGKAWDHGVPSSEVWAEVLRVLKPGAFLLSFGGTRTFHRLTCAIEDAGFEIRDCAMWLYGSGFPKSMDISKALDKAAGAKREVVGTKLGQPGYSLAANANEGRTAYGDFTDPASECAITAPATDAARTWNGYGTALKPAWEPCIVAMKSLDGTFAENALQHGVAGLNIVAGRIETSESLNEGAYAKNKQDDGRWGTMHRSTGQDFTQPAGRWPANLILDEEAGAMLDAQSGVLTSGKPSGTRHASQHGGGYGKGFRDIPVTGVGDSGGASRFFYCAKASRRERDGGLDGFEKVVSSVGNLDAAGRDATNPNNYAGGKRDRVEAGLTPTIPRSNTHPCLKPLDLCRYLASLILPPERDTPRRILVPFSGSGSEMIGALMAGWDEAVGIEMEAEYCAIAEARLTHWIEAPGDFEPEPVDTSNPEPTPTTDPEPEISTNLESEAPPPPVDDFSDLPLFGAGA